MKTRNEILTEMAALQTELASINERRKALETRPEEDGYYTIIDGQECKLEIGQYVRTEYSGNATSEVKARGYDEGEVIRFLTNAQGKWARLRRSDKTQVWRKCYYVNHIAELPADFYPVEKKAEEPASSKEAATKKGKK